MAVFELLLVFNVALVSCTNEVLLTRKPCGVKMCGDLYNMFRGPVKLQYEEDNLTCIITQDFSSTNSETHLPTRILETKCKIKVSVNVRTKKRNKGHQRLTMQKGNFVLKKRFPKGTTQSIEVLSMTGSVIEGDTLFVLEREIKSGNCSCSFRHFSFIGGRCRKLSKRPQGQFNCCGKKVYQIFIGRLSRIDWLFLVTSGDRFEVRLFINPLGQNIEDSRIYLTNNILHGPIFCFFRHGIMCIQKNSLLKIARHNKKISFYANYFQPSISHVTDLSYNPITHQLIIVCRARTILTSFNDKNDKLKILHIHREVKLKVTWLHRGLMIHKNKFHPDRFRTCNHIPIPSRLCLFWTRHQVIN